MDTHANTRGLAGSPKEFPETRVGAGNSPELADVGVVSRVIVFGLEPYAGSRG